MDEFESQLNAARVLIPFLLGPVISALRANILLKVPKVFLPVIAATVGAGGEMAYTYFAGLEVSAVWAGAVGFAGVWLRDLATETKKALMSLDTGEELPTPQNNR